MGNIQVGMWRRREIENYFASERTLLAWAEAAPQSSGPPSLFDRGHC